MYSSLQSEIISNAVHRIGITLETEMPYSAAAIKQWMVALSGSMDPAAYFLHPVAFPIFLLPFWVHETVAKQPDPALQQTLAHSTANGYYYIRLIDDQMDGDAVTPPALLPALGFFHTEFAGAYSTLFAHTHPFWQHFRQAWFYSAEAAMQDAQATAFTADHFHQISGQKVCAAKIPVAAVCHYHGRADAIPAWYRLIELMGCWHQMMNDLFDWRKDETHGNHTYFLAQATRRKRPGETTLGWIMREGLSWAGTLLRQWSSEMLDLADTLKSASLHHYLQERHQRFLRREEETLQGFAQLSLLLGAQPYPTTATASTPDSTPVTITYSPPPRSCLTLDIAYDLELL